MKKPHTKKPEIEIRGRIPAWILGGLEKEYGKNLTVTNEEDELVDVEESEWFKRMQATDSPARSLRVYRARAGLSQGELGKMIGASRQNVYEMEKEKRGISKETAKKLAELFQVPTGEFI